MRRRPGEHSRALTPAQHERVDELFDAALELSPADRRILLENERRADAAVAAEVESLLEAHAHAGILERPRPAWDPSADIVGPALGPGTVVAHYEIEAHLGSGGMGVVYRARDLRLERTVALKFLPGLLGADDRAKRRFLTEARAAAAIDHRNVCTIHEIGETHGRLYIAMAFVEGESLRQLMDRGPLPVRLALDIAAQIAAALQCAHEHRIVHRDVKPGNVMLDGTGTVRLVDFGIAKLDDTTLTDAGATPGTRAYMSPEQLRGEAVDHRTDLWALGVVLYEMLAGARPFTGETSEEIRQAIETNSPVPLTTYRPDVPPAVDEIVRRALASDRTVRFASAAEMADALRAIGEAAHHEPPAPRRLSRRARVGIVAIATLLVLAGSVAGVSAWRRGTVSRALASLPRIEMLAERGEFDEAFGLLERAERVLPGDTTLRRLAPLVADRLTILSRPAGARVWLRSIAGDGSLAADSLFAGVTPVRDLRVARADYYVDVRKDGYRPEARIASSALNRSEASMGVPTQVTIDVTLHDPNVVPEGMRLVPGSAYALVGRQAPTSVTVRLPDFYIDEHEVTNEQFRKFIAAGGYADSTYWRHPFVVDGRILSHEQAMRQLVDRTGLPGPRGWSGQEFPAGQATHPVTGVTWYEAAAYAVFVGKRLPTIFEWEKAARDGRYSHFDQMVLPWGLADPARGLARRANFGSAGTEPVASHPSGLSPYGVHDMAGNVEEWLGNPNGERRFIAGGAWDDPMYVFGNYLSISAFHASPALGFRCVRIAEGAEGDPGSFEIRPGDASPAFHPVDARTYRALLQHYAYDPSPLEPQIVERLTTDAWTRETIRIAGPWSDPTTLYLYLPTHAPRPLQTLILVPGSNIFVDATVAGETERLMEPHVRAGRAVLAVQFKGTRGRPFDAGRTPPSSGSVQYRQELVRHATEFRRAIDYVETRQDLDVSRLGYVGVSLGSGSWLLLAAVEPRIKSVVFIGGGIDERALPKLPEANSVNFAPHIGAPTLMLNGRYDEEHSWDRRARPLWELLREPKRLELVEGGHIPRAEVRVPIINAWFDETLGPVR